MKSWQSIKTFRVKQENIFCYQLLNTQHESPTCVTINKILRRYHEFELTQVDIGNARASSSSSSIGFWHGKFILF